MTDRELLSALLEGLRNAGLMNVHAPACAAAGDYVVITPMFPDT